MSVTITRAADRHLMARKPLRSQLNQIRAWVRQGRTDAWIAHQLDIPTSELREFRRRHELAPEDETDVELRDEIEAEIEATLAEDEAEEEEEEEVADEGPEAEEAEGEADRGPAPEGADSEAGTGRRRRRRRRRRGGGGGGGGRGATTTQATFDHGAEEGYGLWLDPAVADDPVYTEHWAGHRQIEVTIEPDRIVIKRV